MAELGLEPCVCDPCSSQWVTLDRHPRKVFTSSRSTCQRGQMCKYLRDKPAARDMWLTCPLAISLCLPTTSSTAPGTVGQLNADHPPTCGGHLS